MTNHTSYQNTPALSAGASRALPVTITRGMFVVDHKNAGVGFVAGFTESFCIYRISGLGTLAVAEWKDIALGDIRPADPLLPMDVAERDRRNWSATVLREMIGLKQFEFTEPQDQTFQELVGYLCGPNEFDAPLPEDPQ